MMPEHPPATPTTRRQWVGFWCMIVQQTQNAFNDKVAQFMLVALGGAVAVAVESWAAVLISLPYVLFAPLAGWTSDRFAKRNVLVGSALAQVVILAALCGAVATQNMPVSLTCFFMLATQAAFLSPAKIGCNKELLGSEHLGFAAGIQQMTTMVGMLVGQIGAGWIFDARYKTLGGTETAAWHAALLPLVVLAALSVPAVFLALQVPRVAAQGGVRLSASLLVSHFIHLKDLWRNAPLRRAAFGVAFFWGLAAFINLWSVKLAKAMTGGQGGFGSLSSEFMAAASVGMIGGFGLASVLLRRRIELGWVPVAGVAMTLLALVIAVIPLGGGWFMAALVAMALSSAVFLAPLNAWLQDRYPADKRGELQSVVNLQNCLAGILAAAAIMGFEQATRVCGLEEELGLRLQMGFCCVMCAAMSYFSIRLLPADFVRVAGVALIRVVYRIRTVNLDRLPPKGGVLLLPNHVTFADAFFISAACGRPVRFVMDEAFMRHGGIRWFVRIFDTVTIRRDQPREAIRTVIDALQQGDAVCMFPEGQITRTGTLSKLQGGFELIARRAGHPLLPLWNDGAWSSVFSYERGRMLGKRPYRWFRHELTVAFGAVIPPENADAKGLRHAMLMASAEAINRRFDVPVWQARVPAGGDPQQDPAARRRMWINGYQIGQVHALQRRQPFATLADDPALAALPGLGLAFTELFQTPAVAWPRVVAGPQAWVGGTVLRQNLTSSPPPEGLVFYDFSPSATEPLDLPGVVHCPCLAIAGVVVAMSMPDPAQVPNLKDVQKGRKPGTWGRLLPGWFLEATADGGFSAHGPAAPPEGLALPPGCHPDDEGFLARA